MSLITSDHGAHIRVGFYVFSPEFKDQAKVEEKPSRPRSVPSAGSPRMCAFSTNLTYSSSQRVAREQLKKPISSRPNKPPSKPTSQILSTTRRCLGSFYLQPQLRTGFTSSELGMLQGDTNRALCLSDVRVTSGRSSDLETLQVSQPQVRGLWACTVSLCRYRLHSCNLDYFDGRYFCPLIKVEEVCVLPRKQRREDTVSVLDTSRTTPRPQVL